MSKMNLYGMAVAAVCLLHGSFVAAAPRVLPEGQLPDARRLAPPKDYNGYFPFTPPKTAEQWQTRREQVRQQMLVALGLWPMPTPSPLNAVIHGKIDRPEYTIERVYFESFPGCVVSGSLYRPKVAKTEPGKSPGVLVAHGHFPNGRFHEETLQNARNQIAEGAERFECGGRFPIQARCVTLARMGCTVFFFDMMGYADSQQLPASLVHGFDVQNDAPATGRAQGFFSAKAELNLQSVMGVQTYNALRALDFLTSLPEVDPQRIGMTGASGGGTQTMILAALDPRIAASVPVVMVSTSMQGGCTCENASLLRIDTGNIEFAAMFAPKPQFLIAADDWTRELGTKGLPELKELYTLLGKPDQLGAKMNIHFPHNYNFVSRELMYQWFNQHLGLGLPSPVLEEEFEPLSQQELSVWDASHPAPSGGDAFEQKLLKELTEDAAKQLTPVFDRSKQDQATQAERQKVLLPAWQVLLGGGVPAADDVSVEISDAVALGKYFMIPGVVRRASIGSVNPIVTLSADRTSGKRHVLWIDPAGKSGLFDEQGQPLPEVQKLLDAGVTVVGADLFLQGEFLADGTPPTEIPRVQNPRKFLGYTLGYNHAVFAQRVRDILSIAALFRHEELQAGDTLDIVGVSGAGKFVAGALTVGSSLFDKAAIDDDGFRFADITNIWSIDMLPGAVKYGDIPGMLAMRADQSSLWLADMKKSPSERTAAAVEWILAKAKE